VSVPPNTAAPLDVLEHRVGPAAPQPGITAPPQPLPVFDVPDDGRLWIVGVHGGAGETTLANALSGTGTERRWPVCPTPARVLLVARTHLAGLRAAQRAATQWAAGQTPAAELVGLVFVPDGPGRLPKELRDFARVVAGGLPHTWHLPWEEHLRLEDPHAPGDQRAASSRPVRHLAAAVTARLTASSATPSSATA
jgi:hypothetical protein